MKNIDIEKLMSTELPLGQAKYVLDSGIKSLRADYEKHRSMALSLEKTGQYMKAAQVMARASQEYASIMALEQARLKLVVVGSEVMESKEEKTEE